MTALDLPVPGAVQIGKAVGWRLEIAGETIDHSTCWAELGVSLDSGLSPGSVELSIRGLTDQQFKTIAGAWVARESAPGELSARRALVSGKLRIFWRDVVGSDPSSARAPEVIDFALTALSRRSEGLRFVTRIEGRHRIYERIERALTAESDSPQVAEGPIAAAAAVLRAGGFVAGVDFEEQLPQDPGDEESLDVQAGAQVLAQLTALGDAMLRRYSRRGHGAYLIRGSKLLVGPFWSVPAGGTVIPLTSATGFIAAQMQGQQAPIGGSDVVSGSGSVPAARDIWRIQAVGRTDIAPGSVVQIDVPQDDVGLAGGFGLPPLLGALTGAQTGTRAIQVYVNSVRHTSAPNQGWTMELAGVTVAGLPEGAWQSVAASTHETPATGETTPRADAPGRVRSRLGEAIAQELAHRPQNDVAEVRAFHVATEMSGTTVSHAGQSSDLLVGVADHTGAGAARRSEINRSRRTRRASNTPYVTPFAWGHYGLVLPRYPGTRVLVGYHQNSAQDAVDMGALWKTDGQGGEPMSAEAGDWWLILPAGVSTAAAAGTAAVTPPSEAKASHDLVDAQGERRIHVNGFTIRCYGSDLLTAPTDRPHAPDDGVHGGVHIEHVQSGAHISIATNGDITIHATGKLVLEGEGIELKPGGGTVDVG